MEAISRSPDTDKFSYGTTEVTYTATDFYGNNATCVINITVEVMAAFWLQIATLILSLTVHLENHVKNKLSQQLAEICDDELSCSVDSMSALCDQLLSDLEEESNAAKMTNVTEANEAVYAIDNVHPRRRNKIELHFHMIGHSKHKNNQTNINQLHSGMHRMKDALRRSAKKGTLLGSISHRRKQMKVKEVEFKTDAKLLCEPGSVMKALCPPGCFGRKRKHWRSPFPGVTPCTTCEHGSYQPKPGQTDCWHCPGNWTTIRRGSTHVHDCKAPCPPGEISQTGLVPCLNCPPGYSQPHSGKRVCHSDDSGESIGIECLSLPCQNGGVCHSLGSDYFICECPLGFEGSFCELQVKECDSSPCLHGATCFDTGASHFSCSCLPGYTGDVCGFEINECGSDPCQNGGTCIDGISSYTCICADGFQGE
ncbi:hypothetical protein C0J52_10877 [Blattella germanica]|nr:hypothetical protein C0J52_10877 [Blattella germanica]